MKKIILSIIFTILIVSAFVIPCFAEYQGELVANYPFLSLSYTGVSDYYTYVNSSIYGSAFPSTPVNYLNRYRYFYYNGSNSDGNGDPSFLEYFCSDTAVSSAYSISYTDNDGFSNEAIISFPSSNVPRFLIMFDDESHSVVDFSRKSSSYDWDYTFHVHYNQWNVTSLTQINPNNIDYIFLELRFPDSGADYNIISGNISFISIGSGTLHYPLYVRDDYNGYIFCGFQQNYRDSYIIEYTVKCLTVAYSSVSLFDNYACNSHANPNFSLKVYDYNNLPPVSDPEYDEDDFKLVPLIFAIFESPAILLSTVLNFDIFGINFYYLIIGLLTAILTFVVVKLIIKFAKYVGM